MSEPWENEDRDEHGRWTSGGGGGNSGVATAPISAAQLEALDTYKTDGFEINEELRSGNFSWPDLDKVDSAIESQPPLKEDLVTYRCVDADILSSIGRNGAFEDFGFISTTTDKSVAEQFAADSRDWDINATVVEVHIPAGTQVFNYAAHPEFKDQMVKEVLLPRGQTYGYSNGVLTLYGVE